MKMTYKTVICDWPHNEDICGEESAPEWTFEKLKKVTIAEGWLWRNGKQFCPRHATEIASRSGE